MISLSPRAQKQANKLGISESQVRSMIELADKKDKNTYTHKGFVFTVRELYGSEIVFSIKSDRSGKQFGFEQS